jgi:hypothetical protein
MENRAKWIAARVRVGQVLLAAGVATVLGGVIAELLYSDSPYNLRVITGLGIMLSGVGAAYLLRYQTALSDEQSARRLAVEERDERTAAIRARAGNRAFWVSTGLVYAGLMWVSSAENGSLPDLEGDALWYYLAAATLIPCAVYLGSILELERKA